MPNKTNTDRITDTEKEIVRLSVDFKNSLQRIGSLEETLRMEARRLADMVSDLSVKVAANEVRTAHLEKLLDEGRTRRWQVWLAFLGAVLSAAIALVVAFAKK